MVAMQDIQALRDSIAREIGRRRIVLFGSFAYGRPTGDSEVDLLVVMPHDGKPSAMATGLRSVFDTGAPNRAEPSTMLGTKGDCT